ncbi:MAG: hypothetical protein NTY26_18600 [Burkholderiales bacterium]|nr:hypothetical protein [Burkholderiales bacterium]
MRLYEFTNAQEQLALLRVIVDNTWQAIEHEAQQQARAAAQRAAHKPKAGRSAAGKMHSVKPAAAAVKRSPAAQPVAPAAAKRTPTPAVTAASNMAAPLQQANRQQPNKSLPVTAQTDSEQLAQMGPAR